MNARLRPVLRFAPLGLAALIGVASLGACAGDDSGTTGVTLPKSTSGSSGSGISGGVSGGGTSQSTPAPTTAPTATPTPTPAPTATPTPTVYVAYALQVTVSPATATIGVQPANGATAYQATTAQLGADVYMSNGAHTAQATWTSSNNTVASVDQSGLVTSGTQSGTVTITATSTDGKASATATITVQSDGGAAVTIQ